jgi:hypothetical protein
MTKCNHHKTLELDNDIQAGIVSVYCSGESFKDKRMVLSYLTKKVILNEENKYMPCGFCGEFQQYTPTSYETTVYPLATNVIPGMPYGSVTVLPIYGVQASITIDSHVINNVNVDHNYYLDKHGFQLMDEKFEVWHILKIEQRYYNGDTYT